jgi:uncharacterized membrane-anchored protein YjiN (DUF445 family)
MSKPRNRWGTIFLVLAAAGAVFFWLQPWWHADAVRYFRAFFEAGLAGALADWFAVTALFKKPLGIPLPHTDLLVRRKDALAEALPRFLGTFLEPGRLYPVLRELDWAGLILNRWDPEALDELFTQGVRAAEGSPSRAQWEERVVAVGAELLHRELTRHKDELVGPVTEVIKRNAGWKGLFVSRDTVDDAIAGFLDELGGIRARPDSPLGRTLVKALRNSWPQAVAELKPSRWTGDLWRRLEADPEFRAAFNRRAGDLAVTVWEKSGAAGAITGSLGYLLAQTDARSLADRIADAVANDLQYIRVNGAVVGGLAGLAFEAVKSLFSIPVL